MLMPDIAAFLDAVGAEGALVGLDPGTKTIGVAVCDERRTLASPLETIRRTKLRADIEQLRGLIEGRNAKGFIIGMPFNMDGSAGPRAQSVRAFSRHIEDAFGLPVLYQDERLSSFVVEEAMIEADMRAMKRAQRIDALAAAHILESALEEMTRTAPLEKGSA